MKKQHNYQHHYNLFSNSTQSLPHFDINIMPLFVHHHRHQQYNPIDPGENIEQLQQPHNTTPLILSPLNGYLNSNYNDSNYSINNTHSNVSTNHEWMSPQYISNQNLFRNIGNHLLLSRQGHGSNMSCNIL